ncbi:Protein containing DUF1628 [Thermoplasmatales archaeon SCGC AB-539-C06]|nr:Protein containing DUF1628 [Thermoplasmatales archaeon SCGC AB-539-C06]
MINFKGKNAVSEIIGTMILLVIAVSVFAYVFITVTSNLDSESDTNVDIVGKIYYGHGAAILEHQGGEFLDSSTNIIFSIAGNDDKFTLDDIAERLDVELLNADGSDALADDGLWGIGEIIVYHVDFDGQNIDIKVRDVNINTLVMYGNLIEGYIGQGGIWHFDECSGYIIEDATGRNPDGSLIPLPFDLGPQWIDEFNGSKVNCSIKFYGGNSLVNVPDVYANRIQDAITIEAWMKPEGGIVIDQVDFSDAFGFNPHIIEFKNFVYAVVHIEQGKAGILKTVYIGPTGGDIRDEIYNSKLQFESDANNTKEPRITNIYNNTFAIVYSSSNNDNGYLCTAYIMDNGTVGQTVNDTINFDTVSCYEPDIIDLPGEICAIVQGCKNDSGIIRTFEILDNGNTINLYDSFEFVTDGCREPDIIHISGNIYAVAYRGKNDEGIVETFEISDDGTITKTIIDSTVFETVECFWPNIINCSGMDIYGIVYSSAGGSEGILHTIQIEADGEITDNLYNNNLFFQNDRCIQPDITHFRNNEYLILYEGDSQDGFFTGVEVLTNGTINGTTSSSIKFNPDRHPVDGNPTQGQEPNVIHIYGTIFAVAYRDQSPHPGALMTFIYSEGYGPIKARGVAKDGAYGIFSNATTIFGSINNVTISGPLCSPDDWNHVVLTYDQNEMILYCNNGIIAGPYAYNEQINWVTSDLLIGFEYRGYIDEFAIYDRVLEDTERQQHFLVPGSMV